jgi:hypothetical protein
LPRLSDAKILRERETDRKGERETLFSREIEGEGVNSTDLSSLFLIQTFAIGRRQEIFQPGEHNGNDATSTPQQGLARVSMGLD